MRSVYRWAGVISTIIVGLIATPGPRPAVNGSISVTVRTGDGHDNPVGGALISIVGTAIHAVTSAQGQAHVANVPAGAQTITAAYMGSCSTKRTVNVPAESEIALTIWMCADAVSIDTPDDPVVVLADVRLPDASGSHCENDLLKVGHGGVAIPENALALSSGGDTCPGGIAVFSGARALSFMNDATALPWTDAVGDVYDVTRPPRPLYVPVTFWMTGAMNKTYVHDTMIPGHVALANELLTNSMTGLELVADETTGGVPAAGDADLISGAASAIGTGCDNVPQIKATTTIYDPTRLNIYYVYDPHGIPNGFTCVANGGLNIIFIYVGDVYTGAFAKPKPSTLAHEMGHALGLDRPDYGHSDVLAGFFQDATGALNVMNRYAALPTYFSVGQAAQMNLGAQSFLNMPSGTDGSTVRSRQKAALGAMPMFVCGCPEGNATVDCAALNTDIAHPGAIMITPSTDRLACTVTAEPTLTLTCKDTKRDTAMITQGGMPAYGDSKWRSFDPTTVTVTPVNSDFGRTWADIYGANPGTTIVRASGGGPYADIKVTVNPPCPSTP